MGCSGHGEGVQPREGCTASGGGDTQNTHSSLPPGGARAPRPAPGRGGGGSPRPVPGGARGAARAVPHRSGARRAGGSPGPPPPPSPTSGRRLCPPAPRGGAHGAAPRCVPPPVLTCPLALPGSVAAAAWPAGGAPASALAALEPWLPMVRTVGRTPPRRLRSAGERRREGMGRAPRRPANKARSGGGPAPSPPRGRGTAMEPPPRRGLGGTDGAVPPHRPRLGDPRGRGSPGGGERKL